MRNGHNHRVKRTPETNGEPIRILTVITKLELGGAQQVALQTLAQLPAERYRKYLVAGRGGLLDERARALPDTDVRLWASFKHRIAPLHDCLTLFRLVRLLRREKIHIVHTHSSKAGILGRLAAVWAGVPVILHTVHGWAFHEYQAAPVRDLYILLERWAARHTTRLIAVSGATRDKGLHHGIGRDEQYVIVFPGSDLRVFTPGTPHIRRALRAEFGWEPDTPLVGMVGNLKKQKAPLNFIRAAALVVREKPDVRFLLAGDGPLRAEAEKTISALGLKGKFILAGWRQDIPRIMGGLDVLAHSSLWEGLPCVFAQALASGLPVAATDVEGAREVITPGRTGLLVPANNNEALAQAILRLLSDSNLRRRFRTAGLERAKEFTFEKMVARLDALYQTKGKKRSTHKQLHPN